MLWADALCINQGDREKGFRVAMMVKIYKAAFRIMKYLGSPSPREISLDSCYGLPQEPTNPEAL